MIEYFVFIIMCDKMLYKINVLINFIISAQIKDKRIDQLVVGKSFVLNQTVCTLDNLCDFSDSGMR